MDIFACDSIVAHLSIVRVFSASCVGPAADCGIKIWDARSLELKGILPHIHTHGISDVAWDLHSRYLCSASDDKCVVVSDVERRTPVLRLAGHTNYVLSVAYNAQSNLIASGSFDETVKLWDVRWGQCIKDLKVGLARGRW